MVYKTTPGGIMDQDYLMHHGIKGQKWGERRFQNPDGSLTPEGIRRYNQYEKDFGKKTADRLMKDIKKGKTEKQALNKEYFRRKNSTYFIPIASGVAGGIAGNVIGTIGTNALTNRRSNLVNAGSLLGMNALAPNKIYDAKLGSSIGATIGTVLGVGGSTAVAHLANGYKLGDLSKEGLNDFISKAIKYEIFEQVK